MLAVKRHESCANAGGKRLQMCKTLDYTSDTDGSSAHVRRETFDSRSRKGDNGELWPKESLDRGADLHCLQQRRRSSGEIDSSTHDSESVRSYL